MGGGRGRSALAEPNFRIYFASAALAQCGGWLLRTTQAWLVLDLTGSPAALGVVTFAQALPVSILDIYLIDTAVTLGPTCSTTSSNGNEPVSMAPGGATVTISQTAGNLRPNHNYNYCMDIAVFPPSFTASVSWSQ